MDAGRLLKMTIVVTRRAPGTVPDEMGDPTVVDAAPVEYRGWIWQDTANEETANTGVALEQFRLVLHKSAAGLIDSGDRVSHLGTTYEVFGPPWTATNPRTNEVEYVYATVRRTS